MIAVRIFARLREQLGCGSVELAPESAATAADIVDMLAERHGQRWRDLLRCDQIIVAINHEVADWQSPVSDGDEVAFFPPVSGG